MSETKTLTIDSVEEKNGLYIVHSGSQKFGTKEAGIKDFIGKTATFNVAMKQNGKYQNWYLNAPLPDLPKEQSPSNGSSYYDQGKRENTLILCSKDVAVAAIQTGQLDPKNTDAIAEYILAIYTKLSGSDNTPF